MQVQLTKTNTTIKLQKRIRKITQIIEIGEKKEQKNELFNDFFFNVLLTLQSPH